jgi:hydroxypyruvate reductase
MNQAIRDDLALKMNNVVFERNGKLGEDARKMLVAAIQAVDPYKCVVENISLMDGKLIIGDQNLLLDSIGRIFVIGFGKSAVPMAKGIIDILDTTIFSAVVITKDKKFLEADGYKNRLVVHLGGHPVPTSASIAGTKAVLNSLPHLKKNDLVIVLISGGGSALFTRPVPGVSLDDMQALTQVLLKCGADINEINTLRKHLDQVKGGRLAIRLQPAIVKTLILSDVIGDPLDMIASGPTVMDPTTYGEALAIIDKYDVKEQVPSSILMYLNKGLAGKEPETPKTGDLSLEGVQNSLIGTNYNALDAGRNCAQSLGYHSLIISSHLTGKTDNVAEFIDGIIQTELGYGQPVESPWCLLFGGETTVNVQGQGLGGRNQDLVLKMVERIRNTKGLLFVSFATDGDDGPTDAAGAVCDGLVYDEAAKDHQMNIESFIEENDSYHFHQKIGGLIKTGSTGTNVNDLILILGHKSTII